MTDVMSDIEAGEAAVDAVDDGLVAELVARAEAGGVKLTGAGGLLAELTRKVLESALEGELTDHLGHGPGERAEGAGELPQRAPVQDGDHRGRPGGGHGAAGSGGYVRAAAGQEAPAASGRRRRDGAVAVREGPHPR